MYIDGNPLSSRSLTVHENISGFMGNPWGPLGWAALDAIVFFGSLAHLRWTGVTWKWAMACCGLIPSVEFDFGAVGVDEKQRDI